MHRGSSLSAALVLAAALPGQAEGPPAGAKAPRLSWRVAEDAFVEFRRRGEVPEVAGLTGMAVPGFYAYELRDGARFLPRRPGLLDLVPALALTLSGKEPVKGRTLKAKRRFADLYDTDPVIVQGGFKTRAFEDPREIRQEGLFVFSGEARARSSKGRGNGRFVRARGFPGLLGKAVLLQGRLTVSRLVDAIRGRVLGFDAVFKGRIRIPEEGERKFEIEEHWVFQGTIRPGSPAFRRRVREAIERGEFWLAGRRNLSYGRAALALLALLKSNPDRDTPGIRALLRRVREERPPQTYEIGVAIQALEALYEPPNEMQQIREGLIPGPGKRNLPEKDRKLLEDWLTALLANRSRSGGDRWRFHYQGDEGFDNSNTQFAVLGLQAAERCGLKVPKEAWVGLGRHFLREQLPADREEIRLSITTYKELADGKGEKARTRARGRKLKPRGFNYRKPERTTGTRRRAAPRILPAYGSMTCAGVTCLAIVQDALNRAKTKDGRLLGKIDEARRRGLAWLLAHYDVRHNPFREKAWYYYYLYSLERTCELSGIARLGPFDWYFDGAMQLLLLQGRSGAWNSKGSSRGGVVDTSFALLFLKRSVAPVITK